jgi:DNA-binding SARP family transcriptional activator
VRVEVLGPLRVVDGEQDVTPSGPLQRRLLALLVLRRDRVVTVDQAIDALWPDPGSRPADPAAALQNQVHRLRRGLPAVDLVSTGEGYRLASTSVDVDADRLADAVHDGGRDRGALDAAVERWHGPAYPELADTDDGRIEAARLEELRLRAVESRVEDRLADGRASDVVAGVAALVDEHPLRERPVGLLMAALDRTGRRVEALRAFDDFRRRLGDELGTEPSPMLVAQHAALLADVGQVTPPLLSTRISLVRKRSGICSR